MASLQRKIRRGMMFAGMDKLQRKLWHSEHAGKGGLKVKAKKKG